MYGDHRPRVSKRMRDFVFIISININGWKSWKTGFKN
jgi:hypothetical protein